MKKIFTFLFCAMIAIPGWGLGFGKEDDCIVVSQGSTQDAWFCGPTRNKCADRNIANTNNRHGKTQTTLDTLVNTETPNGAENRPINCREIASHGLRRKACFNAGLYDSKTNTNGIKYACCFAQRKFIQIPTTGTIDYANMHVINTGYLSLKNFQIYTHLRDVRGVDYATCTTTKNLCTDETVKKDLSQTYNDLNGIKASTNEDCYALQDTAKAIIVTEAGGDTDIPGWDIECTLPKVRTKRKNANNVDEYRCVVPCDYPYAFRSYVNDACMECKTTKYQGINEDKVCMICDESTQFWDSSNKTCVSKTNTNSFTSYTRKMLADCWRCNTLVDFQTCINYSYNPNNAPSGANEDQIYCRKKSTDSSVNQNTNNLDSRRRAP